MAVGHLLFNDQLPHGRKLRNFLNLLDNAFSEGNEVINLLAQMKNAGVVDQYIADKFGFGLPSGSNVGTSGVIATAQSAVSELESLMGKLNTTGAATVQAVRDAILQAIAKFG